MPYEQNEPRDHQRQIGGHEEFFGPQGMHAGITHLRLRDQWSAWWQDGHRDYQNEVRDTRAEALNVLRVRAPWADLPDA